MTSPHENLPERLQASLQKGAPQLGVTKVHAVDRFTSGLSSQSYRVSAETEQGPIVWVIRVEPEHGVIPPYDIGREYRLLVDMGKAGLPVPEAIYLEEDAQAIGARYMMMSCVDGQIYGNMDPRLQQDPELCSVVQKRFVEVLARVHDAPQQVFPIPANAREATLAQVATCRRRMARVELLPSPIIQHALDILEEKAPEPQKICLLHGDYRLPNLMWKDSQISGVLDWELATVGDPLSDIAFTQTVGNGICSIENEMAQHYGEITGIEMDERKITYYKLLEMAKGSIIGFGGASDLAHGGDDLRLLSVAAVASAGQAMLVVIEAQMEALLEA